MRLALNLVLIAISITSLTGVAENRVEPYPIRNHQSDHTKQFEYKLDEDHLIYLRSLDPENLRTFVGGDLKANPTATEWHVFDRLGMPYKKRFFFKPYSILPKGEFISEIAVASEVLVAVSNTDRVYMYKPTVLKRPISWSRRLGAPFSGELYLPADRKAWSFSCSVRDKAIRRVDFMDPRERVTYYTDQNGVNFDFGFTATIYVLLGDGRRIVYWDTGLPPSFSRGFLTPLYGTTVGQSISAAGSTVFLSVLDSKNQLRFFTRMYDYEINGACPGLAYTYETKSCAADCDKTVPLGFGLRKLPLEGWREHSVAELQKGSVTAQVSIHLTGQGNSARELRIQGTQKGQTGYYFKGIDEGKWRFQVDARLAQSAQPSAPSMKNDPAPALLKDYEGEVLKAKSSGFQVKLKEFHPFLTAEEPSTIEISADGETQKIELHSVDGWTISSHAKHHEDLIGVHDGEPKSLQATIVLTPEQRNCVEFSPLCKILKENFAPYHEVVNNFQLAADDQSVYLRSNDGKLKFNFTRALTQADVDSSYYVKTARNVAKIEAPRGRKKIRELIQLHEATLKELKSLRKQYIQDDQKFALIDLFAVLALPSAKAIFSLDKTDPTYEKAVIDLKSPLRSEVRTEWVKLRDENRSLKVAENILKARMMELEVLAE